jgi:hypothetical protein
MCDVVCADVCACGRLHVCVRVRVCISVYMCASVCALGGGRGLEPEALLKLAWLRLDWFVKHVHAHQECGCAYAPPLSDGRWHPTC